MKTTVLYFSPTGGTEKVAQIIAGELKADALDITTFGYDLSYDADELFVLLLSGLRRPDTQPAL